MRCVFSTHSVYTSLCTKGTDLYETRADKKLRAPAWCDRVLWKSTRVDRDVTMLHYRSAPLHMSDHKPISAMFICNTRKIVKEKLKEVYADLLLTVDKWINESKPKIDVANRLIDFGPIVHNVSIFCIFGTVDFVLYAVWIMRA